MSGSDSGSEDIPLGTQVTARGEGICRVSRYAWEAVEPVAPWGGMSCHAALFMGSFLVPILAMCRFTLKSFRDTCRLED